MRLFPLAGLCLLAACNAQPGNGIADAGNVAEPAATPAPAEPESVPPPADSAVPTPAPAASPGALPPAADRTPVSEAPFTPDSAQGAANVVQTYYALLGEGKYAQAYRLWEPGAAGMSPQAFAASFGRYAEYRAEIGAPGDVDAGAGQRYVTVPVRVYGRLREGNRPFNMRGSVTLHRVADIDGATAAQRSWRIRSADIKPRPGATPPAPAPAATEDNRSLARYRCADGSQFAVAFDPDNRSATLRRGGTRLASLRQQRVASGIRYAGGGYELRGKGEQMTIAAPGRPALACRVIR